MITDGDRVLLVKHKDPANGYEWWMPPGGGLEGEESVMDCAVRETWEETGLEDRVGPHRLSPGIGIVASHRPD